MANLCFASTAPSDQITLDIGGIWVSKVPLSGTQTGLIPLFEDQRIHWLVNRIDLRNRKVLELGSFEGGHSYILSQAGADVVGIEANSLAYVKSLIAKELLQINASFVYGDFMGYLEIGKKFHLVVASGVLYHMINPVELLYKISKCTKRIYLWTHYFDPNATNWGKDITKRLTDKFEIGDTHSEFAGFSYPVVTQKYL